MVAMGYEVLDSRRPRDEPEPPSPTPSGPASSDPRDVLTYVLDDEPPSRDVAPLRRAALLVAAASHGPHRASFLAGAALAVGALAGGAVGGAVGGGLASRGALRTGVLAQERADRQTLAVVAFAGDVVRYTGVGGRTALLDVRVTNAGPRPIEVAVTPAWVDAQPGHPVVRQNAPSAVIAPGTDASVVMTALAHCDDPTARRPTLPVRTLDGTLHAVPIRSVGGALDLTEGCRR
jgi:hypothetical protein